LVTVALLIGLIGGLSLGAIAAARRTQAAFPAFLTTSAASQLQLQPFSLASQGSSIASDIYTPALAKAFARLPHVAHVGVTVSMFVVPLNRQGRPILSSPLGNSLVQEAGGVNGEYVSQDRLVADQGRLADPRRIDEVTVTADANRILKWHVGQVISMGAYTFSQLDHSPAAQLPFLHIRMKVVGVVAASTTVVRDEVDRYPTNIYFTPALAARLARSGAAGFTTYDLRVDHGSRSVALVEHEIQTHLPPGYVYNFHETPVVASNVSQAIKPEWIALAVFGAISALAAFIIGSQAVARSIRANASDIEILRALGATPIMTVTDSLLAVLVAVIAGSLLALLVGFLISPVAPLGAVRAVDAAPGFHADWAVLGSGLALCLLVFGAISGVVAAVMSRRAARPQEPAIRRTSSAGNAAVRAGLPPAAISGVRLALERSPGANSVPVGPALLGAVLAVAVAVTTLTFGNSLSTLVAHPNLYGWNWDYAIEQEAGGSVPVAATGLLSHDRDVGSWAGFDFANVTMDGQTVPVLLTKAPAVISSPILAGNNLENDKEIVLGVSTMALLHKRLGDTVTVSYGAPSTAPIYVPPTTLRIVGSTTLPAIGATGTLHPSMGTGAIVPNQIEPAAMRQATLSPDPNQNGPAAVVIRLRHGVSPAQGLASLRRLVASANSVLARDPSSNGSPLTILPVQQPAEIVNYKTMGSAPAILAAALAFGAMLALGLTLVSSVRRHRRDLALLKTLGFRQRQLGAVVSWQSSVVALVGVAAGVPVGIIVGRWVWNLFAHAIDAVPQPAVPVWQVVLAAVGTVVLANAVALVPGRLAARVPTATLLRAE
jgi:ABC-type lipoprotein release transport system permease subunit